MYGEGGGGGMRGGGTEEGGFRGGRQKKGVGAPPIFCNHLQAGDVSISLESSKSRVLPL